MTECWREVPLPGSFALPAGGSVVKSAVGSAYFGVRRKVMECQWECLGVEELAGMAGVAHGHRGERRPQTDPLGLLQHTSLEEVEGKWQ